jgi:hypothetical protein
MAKCQKAKPPQIGIWWDDGQKLVAFPEPPNEPDPDTHACDSELSHDEKWIEVADQFGRTPDDEYYSVPRGRVLWFPRQNLAKILHGSGTSPERLEVIAQYFRLENWRAEPDVHYSFGTEVDSLFENDD